MQQSLKKLIKGIKINTQAIEEIRKARKNIKYLESEDLSETSEIPEDIREMKIKLLNEAKLKVSKPVENFVEYDEEYEGNEAESYLEKFSDLKNISETEKDIDCLERILNDDSQDLSEKVKTILEELLAKSKTEIQDVKDEFRSFIEKKVRVELFGEVEKKKEVQERLVEVVKPKEFIVRKSSKSIQEVKDIIIEHLKVNETIFNKIIFESKSATLSIADRILEVYFKPGSGYIVNFISEPDTNYGKFYKNLLKVFNEVKEHIYDTHNIVIVPEEGKTISYLNSFYQNYLFLRDKINTVLTQYKLQQSLLNENFTVKYLIFEKISGKYLIFYNGNVSLAKPVEQFFKNQAKLGSMIFTLEFIELKTNINSMIAERLNKIKNKIDLHKEGNYMKVTRNIKDGLTALVVDVTGVKILIDPEFNYDTNDIDIVVMTNSRDKHVRYIPQILRRNPSAKLFTSDMSYKIARVKWLKELNNPSMIINDNNNSDLTRKDLDNVNEKVIRITPKGKGYNFRGLVNIKFFNSGSIPGSAIVEIRDAGHKSIYTKTVSLDDSVLLTGSETNLSEYDYLISQNTSSIERSSLPIDSIRSKLDSDKQVFIFTDSVGNLQHVISELYYTGINKPMVSGEQTFGIINKEIAKLLSYGSSWGDNFQDKEIFLKGIQKIEPFTDEYEFYKKFSTGESLVFLLPFGQMEIDMVMKNKLFSDNLILLPIDKEKEFVDILNKNTFLEDEQKEGKHMTYNYVSNTSFKDIYQKCVSDSSDTKFIISDSDSGDKNCIILDDNKEIEVY